MSLFLPIRAFLYPSPCHTHTIFIRPLTVSLAHPFSHSLAPSSPVAHSPKKYKYKNCAVKAQPQSNLDIDFLFVVFSFRFIYFHTPTHSGGGWYRDAKCRMLSNSNKNSSCFAENSEKFYLYE